MDYPTDILQQWIEAIEENGVDVTPWETEFITSITSQLAANRTLSPRQIEILERIYAERTP